ncbi:isochorismatase family protein [Alphaproteobacteria bacterium HT1-32]|nr:isochorismatase family protein [Alphaproteobacteria bacterium HT1-32]
MIMAQMEMSKTALVLVDMQNDFLHEKGAYARGGASDDGIASLKHRLKPVADAVRAKGGWIVSTHFTLVPGKNGEPFILPHLKELRPFLQKGDFAPGSFGHDVIDELQPIDLKVEKVAYDAFYMSRLEFVLNRAGIETVVFGGIVTNGGVESTVRGAHVRDFHPIVLEDGCAAFGTKAHDAAIASMRTMSKVMTCADFIKTLN